MWLALAACHRPEAHRPGAPTFALQPEVRWALPDTTFDQHHATVTTLPNGDGAVAWTHRQLWEDPESWVVELDPHGDWVGEPIALGDGAQPAAKPDLEADDQGRLWVGYDSYLFGVYLDRLDLAAHTRETVQLGTEPHAEGNNSVDVALSGGGAFATWLVEGDAPYYTARAIDPDLVVGEPLLDLPLDPTTEDGYTSAPPDVEAGPDGSAVIALAEDAEGTSTTAAPPLRLVLERVGADGTLAEPAWTVAEGGAESRPARPTVAITEAGLVVVAWREREHLDPTTAVDWLGVFDAGGDWALEPMVLDPGEVADDAVLALLGDDAVVVAWSRMLDPTAPNDWSVWAGVWSVPGGEPLVAPTRLSSPDVTSAQRPHVAATADGWFLVSWEQAEPGGPLVTWGRTGLLRVELLDP